jgi:hypothetical protein
MNTWGTRKTVGAIAVAAAVAAVGGAAISAATSTGFHAMSGTFAGGFAGPGGPGGPPPTPHRSSPEPVSLHGQYVVADGHGGYSTLMSQTGRVTAISATSVTARSDDGFVQTYVIHEASGGKPIFAVNDEVTIDATRDGQTATVTTISPGH